MHSPLEQYLKDVAANLQPLSSKRRDEELREMRMHLEKAIVAGRDRGLSESDAARETLQQFGTPETVGHEVVTAWQRGEALGRRSFWRVAACVAALTYLLSALENWLSWPMTAYAVHMLLTRSPYTPHLYVALWTMLGIVAIELALGVASPMLAGWISGYAFPKRAVSGTLLGVAVFKTVSWMPGFYQLLKHATNPHDPPFSPGLMAFTIGTIVVSALFSCAITVVSARAGSRWREKRARPA